MKVTCPACKAANDGGPLCRRCKADLSLVIAAAADRERHREAAVAHLLAGDFLGAMEQYRRATA